MTTENEGGLFSCPVMSWIIGALLGLATYLILAGRFGMGTTLSLIIAVVVFAAAGFLLGRLFCRPPVSTHEHPARHDHDIAATPQAVANVDRIGGSDLVTAPTVPDMGEETTSNGVAAAASASSVATASKADRAVAGAKPATKGKASGAATSKAKSASAAGTGAKKAAPKAAAKAKPAAKAATKPARTPVAKDGKPEMLTAARASGADDLKQIKGVGPKMEIMLNKMGFYHFDQISGWRAKEVKWVDENLEGFKGRVSRDEWVKQAKILARGGETEFSKKVEKGGVYAKNKK